MLTTAMTVTWIFLCWACQCVGLEVSLLVGHVENPSVDISGGAFLPTAPSLQIKEST
jgi:hypothetical protein